MDSSCPVPGMLDTPFMLWELSVTEQRYWAVLASRLEIAHSPGRSCA